MNVKDLIQLLHTFPQDMEVGYACMSEYCLIDEYDIGIVRAGLVRGDGWIARTRPDKESKEYLMFPGH